MSTYDKARETEVIRVINELQLAPEHIEFLNDKEFNSSCDTPYHNVQHCYTVALNAYTIGQELGYDKEALTILFLVS